MRPSQRHAHSNKSKQRKEWRKCYSANLMHNGTVLQAIRGQKGELFSQFCVVSFLFFARTRLYIRFFLFYYSIVTVLPLGHGTMRRQASTQKTGNLIQPSTIPATRNKLFNGAPNEYSTPYPYHIFAHNFWLFTQTPTPKKISTTTTTADTVDPLRFFFGVCVVALICFPVENSK